jgi:UDP-N-acetylglucosamine 2-epimerase
MVVCRKTTERPECLGLNVVLSEVNELAKKFRIAENLKMDYPNCPFGDGDSSIKVVKALKDWNLL